MSKKRRPSPTNARELAFTVLEQHRKSNTFIADLLDTAFHQHSVPGEEKRLARELAAGVVRRRLTLEALLQPHLKQPAAELDPPLYTLLQLGAYQLAFLQTQDYAAIHETVEVTKRLGQMKWSGLVNGVLRSVQRNLTDEYSENPGANAIPLTAGQYRHCQQAPFPAPGADLVGYFSAAFSFPLWLAERWVAHHDQQTLFELGFHANTPPTGQTVRVNTLCTTRDDFQSACQQQDIETTTSPLTNNVRLTGPIRIENLPGYADGWFTVQDETAAKVAILLDPQPGERVWDFCAAPGTKTMHLAELMRNEGTILATDVQPKRLHKVEQNAKRLGVEIVTTQRIDRMGTNLPDGPFDRILIDAPCSNTGVLSKRPEARWRIQPADMIELPEIQLRLTQQAIERLTPGGFLVYSTCSIEPVENEEIAQQLCQLHPGVELKVEHLTLPDTTKDGGYRALFQKQKACEPTASTVGLR